MFYGRGEEIRTPDILLPKQARYQTALRPVICREASNTLLKKMQEYFDKKSRFKFLDTVDDKD